MTRTEAEKRLLRLFVEALDQPQDVAPPHVVDDEDLLARWSLGVLDPDEHQALLQHLADCPDCRHVVGLMVRNGALVLPEVPEPEVEPPPRSGRHPWLVAALALAALVLVAISLPLVRPAGETRLGASLALRHFDFEYDGGSYGMAVKMLPESERDQWQAKIEARPADVKLQLEYGRLLLEHNLADEAFEQFHAAGKLEPGNTDALVGQGVARYEQAYNEDNRELYQQASDLFEEAIRESPDDFSARVNAAIVLDLLGQHERATQHWNRASALAPDDVTRQDIDKHRRDRQENPSPQHGSPEP